MAAFRPLRPDVDDETKVLEDAIEAASLMLTPWRSKATMGLSLRFSTSRSESAKPRADDDDRPGAPEVSREVTPALPA